MTRNEAIGVINGFRQMLRDRFAYTNANDFDYESALVALSSKVEDGVSAPELGYGLHKVVAGFIDGHAWVEPYRLADGWLPVRLESLGEQVVAVMADRSEFLVPDQPYLETIDGLPLSEWFEVVMQMLPVGTSAYVRRRRILQLEHIQHWRTVLGLPVTDTVTLGVSGAQGYSEVQLEVLDAPLPESRWPARGSGMLTGGIGYLRLRKMNDEAVREVRTWMPELVSSRGLVIDVRDNTGGMRTPLIELWSWLAGDDDVTIGSVGAYRKWEGFGADHLSRRYMYQEGDPGLSTAQQDAIVSFRRGFAPERDLHSEGFSDWHYLVLPQPQVAGRSNGRYRGPIIVLVNERCFSAVDIFLGALKQLPNVRLLGRPSSGGSAFGVRHELGDGALATRLGSMISFTPEGRLYDTRGFMPDVPYDPSPEEFLVGGTDGTLDAALRILSNA